MFNIIKYDYLQRTRNYPFLIVLCATLAIAYTFVPEPNATYSTIRIGDYVGLYNSAWFGYVTAVMSCIFLSLAGFYLVNDGIKKDTDTKVGQIVASTPASNFKYLFSKVLSNFLMLLTIVFLVFLMGIILFFCYHDGFTLELMQFVKPFVVITVPAMFCISCIAVVLEVLLGKYKTIQNVLFFFLFVAIMLFTPKTEGEFTLDPFGNKIVVHQMEALVKKIPNTAEKTNLTIGYVIGNLQDSKRFMFDGMDFTNLFLLSRLGWIFLGTLAIMVIAFKFHRFDLKQKASLKVNASVALKEKTAHTEIVSSQLALANENFSIASILKTEILMLLRKGKRWTWALNVVGMALLVVVPTKIAFSMVLPILWFLQVNRLSELTIKEQIHNMSQYLYTSYNPLGRLFLSQLLAGIILMISLALPFVLKLLLTGNPTTAFSIILGAVFIVFLASALGIVSKGNKLFEVLFFFITYANINTISFAEYYGSLSHSPIYFLTIFGLILLLGTFIFLMKKVELDGTVPFNFPWSK